MTYLTFKAFKTIHKGDGKGPSTAPTGGAEPNQELNAAQTRRSKGDLKGKGKGKGAGKDKGGKKGGGKGGTAPPKGGLQLRLRAPGRPKITSVRLGDIVWPHFNVTSECVVFLETSQPWVALQSLEQISEPTIFRKAIEPKQKDANVSGAI